jgi:flagella basal body P-ring formation protein FlgA
LFLWLVECAYKYERFELCVAATEIRCQEKSKGGLAYEVILAEPVAVTPPKRPISPNSKVSAENIEEKLKAAEDRRLVRFFSIELVEEVDKP